MNEFRSRTRPSAEEGRQNVTVRPPVLPAEADHEERLARKVFPHVRRGAARILGGGNTPYNAEDALQDGLVNLFTSQRNGMGGLERAATEAPGYAARVGANAALSDIRRRKSRPDTSPGDSLLDTFSGPSTEDVVFGDSGSSPLSEAIAQLDPIFKQVIYLIYFNGMSNDEAAEALGVPPGTIKSRLSRARANLRTILKSKENTD